VPHRGGDHSGARAPRAARFEPQNGQSSPGGSVWFRLNVGRDRHADPKWLLPEICKQGGITKKDIGQIRIFDRDTRFEVNREAAEVFAATVASRQKKTGVRIDLLRGEPPVAESSPSGRAAPDKSARAPGTANAPSGKKPKGRADHSAMKGKPKSSRRPKKRD
jgi:ATP-dependent RNA helicase DeaD